jgi:demethylmenaquinone methyltransferase/2-methoxy-6-polyprenyl-1,4-benzoquinol methylase
LPEKHLTGANAVRRMFSTIAVRYDLLNRIFSFGTDMRWRRELTGEVPDGADPVLDVATGTADVALTLEKRDKGSSLVVGCDFTLPMLKAGAGKVRKTGSGRVRLTAGDACLLPFPDNTFRAATIAFGLRNIPDRVESLRELARVLQPGGVALILEFSRIDRPLIGPLFRFYFHRVMPVIGGLISGNRQAYRYLPQSVETFPDPVQLGREMLQAGLVGVKFRPLTFGIAHIYKGEKSG